MVPIFGETMRNITVKVLQHQAISPRPNKPVNNLMPKSFLKTSKSKKVGSLRKLIATVTELCKKCDEKDFVLY